MSSASFESVDRRVKWSLLLISLIAAALLVYSFMMECVWPPWRQLRLEYAKMLKAKAVDERSRAVAEQFEINIQQNVVPALQAIDRCVTCHTGVDDPRMAGERQPFRTHSGDYLLNHSPDKFGCTICHRGQGRALIVEDAKAVGHHWDYPMLPAGLTQSACGMCHAADEIERRGGDIYAAGKRMFESKGCLGCHKLNGRGGNLGPVLDGVGAKVVGQLPMKHVKGVHTLPQWLLEHFANPQHLVAGSKMKPSQLSNEESEALTVYMLSLQNRDLPKSYISAAKYLEYYQSARPAQTGGEALFKTYCAVCHNTGRFGGYDRFFEKFIPAVRGSTFTQAASEKYITEMIRQGRPGSLMPPWRGTVGGLSDEDIAALRTYLTSAPLADSERLPAEMLARAKDATFTAKGNAHRGMALFSRNCTGCHGADAGGALAPSLISNVFQSQASDGFLFVTIAMGRRNTAMPGFLAPETGGFKESDIIDLVAFLRTLGNPAARTPAIPTATTAARQQEKTL